MVFCGLAGPHGFRGLTPVVFYGFCGLAGPVLGVTGSQKKERRRTCVRSHLASGVPGCGAPWPTRPSWRPRRRVPHCPWCPEKKTTKGPQNGDLKMSIFKPMVSTPPCPCPRLLAETGRRSVRNLPRDPPPFRTCLLKGLQNAASRHDTEAHGIQISLAQHLQVPHPLDAQRSQSRTALLRDTHPLTHPPRRRGHAPTYHQTTQPQHKRTDTQTPTQTQHDTHTHARARTHTHAHTRSSHR